MRRLHFLFFLLVVLSGQIKANPSTTRFLPDEDTLFQVFESGDIELSCIILDEDETEAFKSSTRTIHFNSFLIQNCLQPEHDRNIRAHKDLNWIDFTDLPPPAL